MIFLRVSEKGTLKNIFAENSALYKQPIIRNKVNLIVNLCPFPQKNPEIRIIQPANLLIFKNLKAFTHALMNMFPEGAVYKLFFKEAFCRRVFSLDFKDILPAFDIASENIFSPFVLGFELLGVVPYPYRRANSFFHVWKGT